ncbi:MAG TPA: Gfo/Idh/MocA family oxidoreductase [Geminicoccus sp.]|jgi:predicted dehydrogenase|uniref:Gfo/Idh/MocA family protein n=1 Tax=Geminicoccus sp. TaxID=2024832 RepID=UPI002E37057D|nr:Gfo/Idh/MocA family oxidoreductase [Geminicoccus sp.]HEX2525350.1 Gfo/Idh/MocA family oxidoreductase [Geminicoccus sp.]
MVGCGFFARNHLLAWHHMDGVELVALCDLDAGRLQAAADLIEQAGGTRPRLFADLDQMLREVRPDFVDVVTTMESHEALVGICARHKVPTICQKPFAPDIAAVRRIVDVAGSAGIPLMVHENFRFQGPMMQLKQVLDGGAVGRPVAARLSWRCGFEVFKGQPYLAKVDRLVLLDLVIHVFDLARFLFGEVDRLLARTQKVRPGIAGEDGAVCLLEHGSGVISEVLGSYHTKIDPDPFPETLVRIDGTDGFLEVGHGFEMTITRHDGTEQRSIAPVAPDWGDPVWAMVQESVLNTQAHFIDCLREGREPATSARDNERTFALVEAAYRSAAQGRWVDLATV